MKDMKFEDSIFAGVPGWSPAVVSPDYSVDEMQDEAFLTQTIGELWSTRQHYSNEVQCERKRIRSLDSNLGQMLFQMKLILAKPGRGGGWSSWLVERNISRATADRLVNRFAKSRGLYDQLPHDPIKSEPSEIQITTLFAHIWPRCERVLTDARSRFDFLRCFLFRSELSYESQVNGLIVYDPALQPRQEAVAPHVATAAAPTSNDDDYGDVL